MEKTCFTVQMEYSPNGKDMVLWKIAFELVIFMVKAEKYSVNDTVSLKISLMHYMQLTRVVLPVVFKVIEMIYMFLLYFFLFTIIVNW